MRASFLSLAVLAACADKPLKPDPLAEDRYAAAEADYLAGRFDSALATIDGVPEARALDLAGRCHMGRERHVKAASCFEASVAAAPDPVAREATRARLARACFQAGDFAAALTHARRVLESPVVDQAAERGPLLSLAAAAAARTYAWSESEKLYRELALRGSDEARARLAVVAQRTFMLQHGVFASEQGARDEAGRRGADVLAADGLFVVVSGRYDRWEDARAAAGEGALAVP